MCLVCRRRAPKTELRRIGRSPDGALVLGDGPGRGAYVCGDVRCLAQAVTRGRLARALRSPLSPEELDRLQNELQAPKGVS